MNVSINRPSTPLPNNSHLLPLNHRPILHHYTLTGKMNAILHKNLFSSFKEKGIRRIIDPIYDSGAILFPSANTYSGEAVEGFNGGNGEKKIKFNASSALVLIGIWECPPSPLPFYCYSNGQKWRMEAFRLAHGHCGLSRNHGQKVAP